MVKKTVTKRGPRRKLKPGTAQNLAKNIRFRRGEIGYSQERLAFEAGCTRNYVGDLENEKLAPNIVTLEALADALGYSLSKLLDDPKVKPVFEPKLSTRRRF